MSKLSALLRDTQKEIFIFGTTGPARAALSLLWAIGRQPVAFANNNEKRQGTFVNGIPVISPDEAFSGKISPIVMICPCSKKNIEDIKAQVSRLTAGTAVFFTAYDIERAYIEEKRDNISFSKMEDILGKKAGAPDSLNAYLCSVERNYDSVLKDILQVAALARGIRTLEIKTPSCMIDESFLAFMKEVRKIDNILYITLNTDPYHRISDSVLSELKTSILEIKFYNYTNLEQAPLRLDLEYLLGKIPFSYKASDSYPHQIAGNDDRLLTVKRLRDVIAEDLGADTRYLPALPPEKDEEVCFILMGGGLGNQILNYLWACFVAENTSKHIVLVDTGNYFYFRPRDIWGQKMKQAYSDLGFAEEMLDIIFEKQHKMSFRYYDRLEFCEIFSCGFTVFSELFDEKTIQMLFEKWDHVISNHSSPDVFCSYLSSLNCQLSYYMDDGGYRYFGASENFEKALVVFQPECVPINGSATQVPIWYTAPMPNSLYTSIFLMDLNFWNLHNRSWAQSKLTFPEITDEYNRKLAEQITKSDSVIVHIRRGDCVYLVENYDSGILQHYKAAIQAVMALNEYPQKKYFVFSDEIAWCKSHENELGLDLVDDLVYVDGNSGKNAFRDMQLMSKGKIMILASSSFSRCAFILSKTVEKYVVVSDTPRVKDAI